MAVQHDGHFSDYELQRGFITWPLSLFGTARGSLRVSAAVKSVSVMAPMMMVVAVKRKGGKETELVMIMMTK